MTPEEIIAEARIPGTQSVLVLGSFEKRVTVYAQQVRALNLADAILAEGLARVRGKIAIVGGGAAGITAAVALAKAAPQFDAIDLFEARPDILELQRGSTRYLHPHFYDWPAEGSDQADAGLPIMNWHAGSAGDVAAMLRAQFDEARRSSILALHTDHRVSELVPSDLGPIRVVVPDATAIRRIYDVVILAIGFGLEAYLDGDTSSYWTPTQLAGPIHTQMQDPVLFISGNGDGGLVDFIMAAFNALQHREICELLMALDLGAACAELQAIERETWGEGADVDLLAQYRARLRPLIPVATWAEIADRLRPNVRIKLHTREPRLLRRTSALHNRLAVFLILEADREVGRNAITTSVGADFAGGAVPMRGQVEIDGEAPFTPYRRFLRLGPDSAPNLAPFATLLATYPGAVNPSASATQPASPVLTASARARFEGLAAAAPAIIPAAQIVPVAANASSVLLSAGAGGEISWSGDVGPDAVDQLWADGRSLTFYSNVSAANAAALVPAIARLGAHAQSFVIHAREAHGWRAGMGGLCAGKALPGPDLHVHCAVEEWRDPPAFTQRVEAAPGSIAQTVQERLDLELLRQLNASLFDILGPAAAPMGWPIEPALRGKLWVTWEGWHGILATDHGTRRRFLRLLATEDDSPDPGDALLVRLGPKIIRPFLANPAIFGLTFAVCSGHGFRPAGTYPGNIASTALTGHSCGVGWINERVLGTRCVSQQAWTTGVVLLSQLREAFQMLEGDMRMDRSFSDPASVGMISPGEEPLIIGADEVFVSALEAGEPSVHDYLQSIFRWRSRTARESLEEVGDGHA